jgi:hypothetical protein
VSVSVTSTLYDFASCTGEGAHASRRTIDRNLLPGLQRCRHDDRLTLPLQMLPIGGLTVVDRDAPLHTGSWQVLFLTEEVENLILTSPLFLTAVVSATA